MKTKQTVKQEKEYKRNKPRLVYSAKIKRLGLAAAILTVLTALMFFIVNTFKPTILHPAEELAQLETRLLLGDKSLTEKEMNRLCDHYLRTDIYKYNKYCLNAQAGTMNNLAKQYLINKTKLTFDERLRVSKAVEDFVAYCANELAHIPKKGKSRNNFADEIAVTLRTMKDAVEANDPDIQSLNTEMYKYAAYVVYTDIMKEKTLTNFKYVYNIDGKQVIFDKRSLFHIGFRHLLVEGYSDNYGSIFKNYKTYDQVIIDLNRLLSNIELHKIPISKSDYHGVVKSYVYYFLIGKDNLDVEVSIRMPNKHDGDYVVKTYFTTTPKHPSYLRKLKYNTVHASELDTIELNPGIKLIIKP